MIEKWRRSLEPLLRDYQQTVTSIKLEKESLAAAEESVKNLLEAQKILQNAAKAVQNKAHRQISRIVSRCLTAVFEKPYELRIEFEAKRGKTEAKFVYLCDGRISDPHTDSGGVMEVASLALRLAALTLTMPPARKLLVLDEPFVGISAGNLPKMALLLETLSKELDMQIIVVTHSNALEIGDQVQL